MTDFLVETEFADVVTDCEIPANVGRDCVEMVVRSVDLRGDRGLGGVQTGVQPEQVPLV